MLLPLDFSSQVDRVGPVRAHVDQKYVMLSGNVSYSPELCYKQGKTCQKKQKIFKFGVRFGRNDLNLKGHLQMGYNSKTIKNYGPVEKQLNQPESTTSAITEPNNQLTEKSEN